MSLAASATRLVWEHSPRRKPLKTLQPVKSQTMEAAPFSGDYSFGESSEESLEMRILDPIHNPGWDHVVALHRDAGCFHTSAWAKVLHQTYNHRPFYLRFSRGRRLAALVPLMEVRSPFTGRRGVCLPFSDVCEPLIFDQEMVGFTVLAHRGSRPIASAIFFRFGKNALYKYGASDKRFQELRANNLVMWQGIQFLARTGAEKLHFGRTECENDGLRRFKLSWGTEEETIGYFRVDPLGRQCLVAAPHDPGFHTRIFGRLPLVLNRLAGSMIYPHLD